MVANTFKPQQGFILAAVLWVLAIMLIAVGIFHSYVQRKLLIGLQAKAHITQSLDQISTEQTVLYLLSTNRMTRAGLTFTQLPPQLEDAQENMIPSDPMGDELWVDDTVYKGLGTSLFSIQDSVGLVDLNAPDLRNLELLLNQLEPDSAIRVRLIGALIDYIDSDDLISIGGAEKRDYFAKGMAAPTNDYLRSPVELRNVYGWKDWLELHPQVDYVRWFGFARSTIMNFNAMPKELLVYVAGLSPAEAERYLVERHTNPITYISEYSERFKLADQADMESRYRTFPTRLLRLSFWNEEGGQVRMISLQLLPNGLLEPWQVDYEYSVQRGNDNNEPLAIRQTTLFGHTLGDDR